MNDFKEYKAAFLEQNDLAHFGILGMRWGVRRYQNPDGSLTAAGRKRYGTEENFNNIMDAAKKGGLIGAIAVAKAKKQQKNKPVEKKTEVEEDKEAERSTKNKGLSSSEFTRIRNSFKSDEAKDQWERAYDTDKFDLDFLERTEDDWSDQKVYEEYAKYLDKKWNKILRKS